MVQQGDFTVEIVEANTKAPFKEHKKADQVYVEVEPGLEYYVNVMKTGTSLPYNTYIEIWIDNKFLRYTKSTKSTALHREPRYCGLRSVRNGCSTHTALKFESPREVVCDSSVTCPDKLMGTLEIKVFRDNRKEIEVKANFNWNGVLELSSKVQVASNDDIKGKKVLRTTAGTSSLSKTKVTSCRAYSEQPGELVDTITLKYCATPGLVAAGVLDRPNKPIPRAVTPCHQYEGTPVLIDLSGDD